MKSALEIVGDVLYLALVALLCSMLWKLNGAIAEPKREPTGSTITFDFTSPIGQHHVLTQLGTVEQREEALRRHLEDALALVAAVERIKRP